MENFDSLNFVEKHRAKRQSFCVEVEFDEVPDSNRLALAAWIDNDGMKLIPLKPVSAKLYRTPNLLYVDALKSKQWLGVILCKRHHFLKLVVCSDNAGNNLLDFPPDGIDVD